MTGHHAGRREAPAPGDRDGGDRGAPAPGGRDGGDRGAQSPGGRGGRDRGAEAPGGRDGGGTEAGARAGGGPPGQVAGVVRPGVRTVRQPVAEIVADLRRRGTAPRVVGPVTGKGELLEAFGAALDFPDRVGANWDALHDALRDLSWRPPGPQVVVWVDPAVLERASPGDHELALRVLREAAAAAAGTARPLTVLLVPPPAGD